MLCQGSFRCSVRIAAGHRFLPATTEEYDSILRLNSMADMGANREIGRLGLTWAEFRVAIEGGEGAGGFNEEFTEVSGKIPLGYL